MGLVAVVAGEARAQQPPFDATGGRVLSISCEEPFGASSYPTIEVRDSNDFILASRSGSSNSPLFVKPTRDERLFFVVTLGTIELASVPVTHLVLTPPQAPDDETKERCFEAAKSSGGQRTSRE